MRILKEFLRDVTEQYINFWLQNSSFKFRNWISKAKWSCSFAAVPPVLLLCCCLFAYAYTLWVMLKCESGFGWSSQTSRAYFKICVIITRVQSKLTTAFQKQLKLRLSLSCSPSACWCLIEMTLAQTAEHVWSGRKKTAGCHRTVDLIFGWFRFGGRTNIKIRFMKKKKT